MADNGRKLKIAFCVYRGNPYSGGQGVYTKHLTEALTDLGHSVTVFSGPPYPELDGRVELVKVPSLELYRDPDPFRVPKLSEFRTIFDLIEFGLMSTGAFPEPRVFGYRARRLLRPRMLQFDVLHDNQSLSWSIVKLQSQGLPTVASIHHPITVDRELEFAAAKNVKARIGIFRFYSFVGFQKKVARRIPLILTVSEVSKVDMVASMKIDPERVKVVPIAVDTTVFRPIDTITREKHQIVTTASADVALKGLIYLVAAVAELIDEFPTVTLVIIGAKRENSDVQQLVKKMRLEDRIFFLGKVSQTEIVEQYARATVACVPSVYEGFSLPAIEAMACGTPLVVTDGGALPEVVGQDQTAALIARAKDGSSLASAIATIFRDEKLARSLSHHARLRVLSNYSWRSTALATVECYYKVIDPTGLGYDEQVAQDDFQEPQAYKASS